MNKLNTSNCMRLSRSSSFSTSLQAFRRSPSTMDLSFLNPNMSDKLDKRLSTRSSFDGHIVLVVLLGWVPADSLARTPIGPTTSTDANDCTRKSGQSQGHL